MTVIQSLQLMDESIAFHGLIVYDAKVRVGTSLHEKISCYCEITRRSASLVPILWHFRQRWDGSSEKLIGYLEYDFFDCLLLAALTGEDCSCSDLRKVTPTHELNFLRSIQGLFNFL
jgi:hypothetical protein